MLRREHFTRHAGSKWEPHIWPVEGSAHRKGQLLSTQLEASGFSVVHSEALYEILDKSITELLMESLRPVREIFGQDASVAVEGIEDEDGSRKIVVQIRPNGIDDRLSLLRKFDRDWWLAASPRAANKVIFNLGYR